MRIAWCSDAKEYPRFNARVVKRIRGLGHEVSVFHAPEDLESPAEAFDVGILRTRDAPEDPPCCQVAAELERQGLPFVNSLQARNATRDKTETHRLLDAAGLPQPAWGLPDSPPAGLSGRTIVKPRLGGRGEGIRNFDTPSEALAWARATEPDGLFVQDFISRAAAWRVIATPERVLRSFRKFALWPGRLPTATAGRIRIPRQAPAAVAELAQRMVAAVGGDLLGADIVVVREQPLAMELNTNFGLSMRDRRLFEEISEEFARASRRGVAS